MSQEVILRVLRDVLFAFGDVFCLRAYYFVLAGGAVLLMRKNSLVGLRAATHDEKKSKKGHTKAK